MASTVALVFAAGIEGMTDGFVALLIAVPWSRFAGLGHTGHELESMPERHLRSVQQSHIRRVTALCALRACSGRRRCFAWGRR
jgi:hypothetical protein